MTEYIIIGGASVVLTGIGTMFLARKGLRSEKTCDTLREQCQSNIEKSLIEIKVTLKDNTESNTEMGRQIAELVGHLKGQRGQNL